MFKHLLAVALGGALGACARYLTAVGMARVPVLVAFPFATLAVNVVGSFLLGWLMVARLPWASAAPLDLRLLFGVGFLGAFTTFSTFAHQTVVALRAGEIGAAIANIVASVVLSLLACGLGMALGAR